MGGVFSPIPGTIDMLVDINNFAGFIFLEFQRHLFSSSDYLFVSALFRGNKQVNLSQSPIAALRSGGR
jgi:hypothetical protein